MVVNRSNAPLRVLFQFLRAREASDPYAFHFEPQDYILPTAGGDSPTARFDWTPEVLADLHAVRLPGRDPAVVQRVGERLRRFVKDAGWAQQEREIGQALVDGRPIFLTIRSSAAELYALPWELLTLKSGQFIGEVDGLLLRFEWPENESAQEQPMPRPEGGRILLAWSAAAGAVPALEHRQAIRAACALGFHPFHFDKDVVENATLGHIVQRLEEAEQAGHPIAILHLLCHGAAAGSTFGLALDGDNGPVVVDAAQLRQHLAPFAKMVRLIVLSACDSGNLGTLGNQMGSVAQALHRCGFQAVIASRFPLSVAGSVMVVESFYGELMSGPASLETAILAARKRLARSETNLPREQRPLDWASLQLYANHGDGDDTRPLIFRPFRGLLAFQPEHRRFFFGRDKEILAILTDLQALIDHNKERFLIVAGASGTGKSSLVLAGAVPQLLAANQQLACLRMRPGSDPARALNEALAPWAAGTAALLVVDQFEEVFTQTESPTVREAFVRRLWSLAAAPEPGLRIIITLRVDFIGRCGELVVNAAGQRLDRVAYDEEHRVFVAQLEPAQLRAAIVEPARKVGLELQAGLADRMLEDVGHEPGALPLLEDALDVLWQHRDKRTLTQTRYDELGGVIGALQRRADAIICKLAKEDLHIAQRLLVNLVAVADDTTLDTRLRVALADLQHNSTAAPAAGFERVLKELVSARLLVQDDDEQTPRVEVAHEALIRKWPQLRTWLDEDRAGLIVQRRVKQAAQQWTLQHHDESLLYRGAQLAHAREWRKSWEARLGALERQFLNASDALQVRQEAEAADRQRRERETAERLAAEKRQQDKLKLEAAQTLAQRTRIAAVVLGVAFLIAVVAGVQAHQKSQEAHDALLVAIAQTQKDDPTVAAILLREARHKDSPLWIQAASDALQAGIAEVVLRDKSSVSSVAFSPDGKKIVTGSGDKTARVWNADGSGAPFLLKGHTDYIAAVAFSPQGTKVATGSSDKTARIWNADGSGTAIVLNGHEGSVTSVAFSPDGTKIATGSMDKTLRVWNADGSGTALVLNGHEAAIRSVAFSPDGKKIVTGSEDQSARIWNVDGSGTQVVLTGHQNFVASVAFSPDGKKIVTGSWDKTTRIWNADGSGTPAVLTGHQDIVKSVAFSPDGKRIVTGSEDNTARIWSTNGSGNSVVIRNLGSSVYSVAFSSDGKKIATGLQDQSVRIWNADFSGAMVVLKGHEAIIWSVAFSPDGRKIATGSDDLTARIWNADGSATPVVLKGHADAIWSVAFSPDGKKVVTGSQDKTARIWNADGSGTPVVFSGHKGPISKVAFSSDGEKIITESDDQTERIWNADGSGTPSVLKVGDFDGPGSAYSPDGKKHAFGSKDKNAYIKNTDGSGTPVVLKGHADRVLSVAFSPDGTKIATGSRDKTVRIWIVASDALLAALWNATTDCLPETRRHYLLLESLADAKRGYERCRQEVARRRAWSAPPAP